MEYNKEFDCFVPQYLWAKTIKEMDNYKCAYCGSEERLQAHHIVYQSEDAELRNSLLNGVTLCYKCHKKAHALGFQRTREEMSKYNWYGDGINGFLEERFENTIIVSVPRECKEWAQAHAESRGMSLTQLIVELIEKEIES